MVHSSWSCGCLDQSASIMATNFVCHNAFAADTASTDNNVIDCWRVPFWTGNSVALSAALGPTSLHHTFRQLVMRPAISPDHKIRSQPTKAAARATYGNCASDPLPPQAGIVSGL
jgi:hypothetical protein